MIGYRNPAYIKITRFFKKRLTNRQEFAICSGDDWLAISLPGILHLLEHRKFKPENPFSMFFGSIYEHPCSSVKYARTVHLFTNENPRLFNIPPRDSKYKKSDYLYTQQVKFIFYIHYTLWYFLYWYIIIYFISCQ